MNLCLLLYAVLIVTVRTTPILRPNLYFGTRTANKNSHLSGMMWFEGSRLNSVRHECRHEDDIKRWGWVEYDENGFGKQTLRDVHNFVDLQMSYIKEDDDWILQIEGSALKKDIITRNISLIFYLSVSGTNASMTLPSLSKLQRTQGFADAIDIPFYSDDYGYGRFFVQEDSSNRSPTNLNHPFSALHIKTEMIKDDICLKNSFWYSKERSSDPWRDATLMKNTLEETIHSWQSSWQNKLSSYRQNHPNEGFPSITRDQLSRPTQPLLPNTLKSGSTFVAVQRVVQLPFRIQIMMKKVENKMTSTTIWNRIRDSITSTTSSSSSSSITTLDSFQQSLTIARQSFQNRFSSIFDISAYPTNQQQAAQAAISNLIGSISYFVGDTIQLDREGNRVKGPAGILHTAIPGRSFFPRGFLWDEGFHQLIVSEWNLTLSLTILDSWMNRIESNGYVEREQILGSEARSRVPDQFVAQDLMVMNPPTLMIMIDTFIQRVQKREKERKRSNDVEVNIDGDVIKQETDDDGHDVSLIRSFLSSAYPSLTRWIDYIIHTQHSSSSSSSSSRYRWYGRTSQHCLASGLDDFPRHSLLSSNEGHIDLLAWIIYATQTLSSLTDTLNQHLVNQCHSFTQTLQNTLNQYWDPSVGFFGDIGMVYTQQHDEQQQEGFETHIGYPGLLPFSLQLLNVDDNKIPFILDAVENPDHLWSEFGLRSLSKSDTFFSQGENYWRALKLKYMNSGPYAERCKGVYDRLRTNLVKNIMRQYKSSGFFWENYDSITGKGTGVHPFTGWTTLVVLIMSEKYN